MSAAKMVADSTQGDVPEMSSTKKRKKMVQKKKMKKKKDSVKRSKKKSQDDFDDCDLDLDCVIHPIGYYVKDREILLQQMFHCVRGQSLNRTLPDVLKDLPIEDLQKRCIEQLEVMSKKRILRILAGDDPASISSSGTEEETSEEEVLEMEEGEYESMDAQVVDSTSLYTQEACDSDRECDHDEGSVVHSSQSAYLTDDEQTSQQQFEDDCEDANASDQDVHMEYDIVSEPPNTQREPEEPEEGEVFDDICDSNEVIIGTAEETEKIDTGESIDNSEKSNVDEASKSKSDETNQVELCIIPADNTEAENEKVSPEIVKGQGTVVDAQDYSVDLKTVAEEHGENVYNCESNDKDNEATDTEKTDGNNESTSTVESDIGIVKNEDSIDEKKVVDTHERSDEKGGNENTVIEVDEGQVLVVEADHVIDEEAANIGADGTGKENLDEGEVSDEEKKQKGAIKSSEVVVSEVKKVKHPRRIVRPPSQDIAPALTRNQMELLELEMRARAIKAMLKMSK